MSFSSIVDRVIVSGFSEEDEAAIIDAMRVIYEGSVTAREMFDVWLAEVSSNASNGNIRIEYSSGYFGVEMPGNGHLKLDVNYLTNAYYINNNGTAVKDTLVSAIAHELVHALEGTNDDEIDITPIDYKGDTVRVANAINSELGLPEQNSYYAYDQSGNILLLGFQYTGGVAIDRSQVVGSNWDSSPAGNSVDLLVGSSAQNSLSAGEGDDYIYGNGGNDTLDGGAGTDKMYGGEDDDTYIVDNESDAVYELAGQGDDTVKSSATFTLGEEVENLTLIGSEAIDGTGNSLDNKITGNSGKNHLTGGDGWDIIRGGGGNDVIIGGSGGGQLYGDDGEDVLLGGGDSDLLMGGGENDTLIGDGGSDVLYGDGGTDLLYGVDGHDYYFADAQDTILDSDGQGGVYLGNKLLGGGKRKASDPEDEYKGGGNVYVLNGTTLVINGGLTINQFTNGDLGIILETEPEDPAPPPDGGPSTGGAETKRSPIVIDLDGDGVETLPLGENFFDLDADGLSESTGWVKSDDGLLVHDRDGNGRISNGTELFGNHSLLSNGDTAQNGFQALAEYDNNSDGLVNAQDASYASLQVWRDLNGNGVSDEGELQSLADAGVVSISTGYANSSHVDAYGHEHRQIATVMLSNGTASTAADVWFKVDSGKRVNSGDIELTPDVVFLANAKGYGKVHDLHQAMVLDPELKNLLNQYVSAEEGPARDALLDNLIYRWAGAADVDPYSRDPKKVYGHVMDARQLVTLENLVGRPYMGIWCWGEYDPNPHGQAAPILVAEYLEFKRFTAAQILAQTEYASELDIIKSAFGSDAHSITVDWGALQGKLDALLANEQVDRIRGVITVLTDLGTYSPRYSAERDAAFQAIIASRVDLAPFFDFSIRVGTAGADILQGVNAGTTFYGAAGDDGLYGYAGGDSYHFSRSHGDDRILDVGGNDQLLFGAGITQSDLEFSRNATSVWITIRGIGGGSDGSIRIDNFIDFDGELDHGAIEKILFSDGSSLTANQVLQILATGAVTPGDDQVFGSGIADALSALAGNDVIYGYGGNDSLSGNEGGDQLLGGNGADQLNGGAGNDTLIGGLGNDIYLFSAGHGLDVVDSYDNGSGKLDRIVFESTIDSQAVELKRVGNDLVIHTSAVDQIKVPNYFADAGLGGYAVQEIVFSDGVVWDIEFVRNYILRGTAGNDLISGFSTNDVLSGQAGNDTLNGDAGNDTLDGGSGNDILSGGAGNDVYHFARGYGQDVINNYDNWSGRHDVLEFSAGILPSDIRVVRTGQDLILKLRDSDDQISVTNFFQGDAAGFYRIDEVRFSGGESWDVEFIKLLAIQGTDGADNIIGYASNDVLDGGLGNDTLSGSAGNDIYLFGRGCGQDVINNYDSSAGRIDALQFASGISPTDITVVRSDPHLILKLKGTEDQVMVINFFTNDTESFYKLDEVRFSSGLVWDVETVKQLALQGTEGNDNIIGYRTNDRLDGKAGDDFLSGGYGNDTYVFGYGYGKDVVSNYDQFDPNPTQLDVIEFTPEVRVEDVKFYRDYHDNLFVYLAGSDDQLKISLFFQSSTGGNDSAYADPVGPFYYELEEFRFSDGTVITAAQVRDAVLTGTAGGDFIVGYASADSLFGYAGNDEIDGSSGNDYIDGGAEHDHLYGGLGNDTIIGGDGIDYIADIKGSNTVDGGAGNDEIYINPESTLIFGSGYGYDQSDISKVSFSTGSSVDGWRYLRSVDDLVILSEASYADRLKIRDYFSSDSSDVQAKDEHFALSFQDGMVVNDIQSGDMSGVYLDLSAGSDGLSAAYSTSKSYSASADLIGQYGQLSGAGYFIGGSNIGNDLLIGSSWDDEINGRNGDDVLLGMAGSDYLLGGAGSDTLVGGLGDDAISLSWDSGSKVIIFNKGDGRDVIYQSGLDASLNITGYSPSEVIYRRSKQDLYIEFQGTTDSIRMSGFFDYSGHYGVNGIFSNTGIAFEDGTALDATQMMTLAHAADHLPVVTGETAIAEINSAVQFDVSTLLANDYDLESTLIYVSGVTSPVNGVVNLSADGKTITFVPYVGFSGEASFTYLVSDGVKTAEGTVSIAVGAPQDPPAGGAVTINSGAGNDWVRGGDGDDYLNGEGGSDSIYGKSGNDTLIGGAGDDYLSGGDGADTYHFGRGSGNDSIYDEGVLIEDEDSDNYYWVEKHESIIFGPGITQDDIVVGANGTHLLLTIRDTGETLRITHGLWVSGFDGSTPNAVQHYEFADGSSWNLQDVLERVQASDGSEYLVGNGNANHLVGLGGYDELYGNGGNDTLDGGAGDDWLRGGLGDDTFVFGRGYGTDVITSTVASLDNTPGKKDVIRFADDISPDDIEVSANWYELCLTIRDTGDQLQVESYFLDETFYLRPVQEIHFADGTIWDFDAVFARVVATPGDDFLPGLAGDDLLQGLAGNDHLFGNSGNDTLDGGAGDDYLEGGAGDDTYLFGFGSGNDTLTAPWDEENSAQHDVLLFAEGVELADITARREWEDLLLSVGDAGDQVRFERYFPPAEGGYTSTSGMQIRFADGSLLDAATLDALLASPTGTDGDDVLFGSSGADLIQGLEGYDELYGGAGNDTLDGGAGEDLLYGGAGDDVFVFGRGSGNDYIEWEDIDQSGDRVLLGAGIAESDILVERDWYSLTLTIADTGETLWISGYFTDSDGTGRTGLGTIQFASGQTWGLAAIESRLSPVAPTEDDDYLFGTSAGELLQGLGGDDRIDAGAGNDTLIGGAGSDQLKGGGGDDLYMVMAAADHGAWGEVDDSNGVDELRFASVTSGETLVLGEEDYGLDRVVIGTGTAAAAVVSGTNALHVDASALLNGLAITGNAGGNRLTGTAFDDRLDGGAGNDTLTGWMGDDTYVINSTSDLVVEAYDEGVDTIQSSVTLTLGDHFENLTLTGSSALNGTGNALDNVVIGNSGKNILTGGAGNDRLDGGAGNDTLRGGVGDDTYVVNTTSDVVTENASEGTDTVESSVTLTLGSHVENLTLMGSSALSGTGNALGNVLKGNAGNNSLTGAAGNDTLDGQGGNDTLTGGTGNDAYLLGRGYGADTAVENDATAGNTDVARFLEGIAADQLWFRKLSNNLEVSVIGTSDKLTVKNWYLGNAYHVEQFKTADGQTLLDSQVQNLVNAMAAFAPPAAGQTSLPENYQAALASVIAANWQ